MKEFALFMHDDATQPETSEAWDHYIVSLAQDLNDAATALAGNPAFEYGGTVEIRELTKD